MEKYKDRLSKGQTLHPLLILGHHFYQTGIFQVIVCPTFLYFAGCADLISGIYEHFINSSLVWPKDHPTTWFCNYKIPQIVDVTFTHNKMS